MGMASYTDNMDQVKGEFSGLNKFFQQLKKQNDSMTELSIGMSGDYSLAIECGSTMVRIGSAIFGAR